MNKYIKSFSLQNIIIVSVVILLIYVSLIFVNKLNKSANKFIGTEVSDTVKTLIGSEVKTYIINFFSPACNSCREEIPHLLTIKSVYKIPIYGFSYKIKMDNPEAHKLHAHKFNIFDKSFTNEQVVKEFNVKLVPYTCVIHEEKVVYCNSGALTPLTFTKLIKTIKKYKK